MDPVRAPVPPSGELAEATVSTDISSADSSSADASAIPLWNAAYDEPITCEQGNLWGDPPVPYAATAAKLFAEHSAAVVLDLPCGDGRNLPPLAQGAPILLAGDTATNAMASAEKVVDKAGIRNKVVFARMDAFTTGLLDNSVD